MTAPSLQIRFSGPPTRWCCCSPSGSHGASFPPPSDGGSRVSRRDRRDDGGDFVRDFCSSSPSASRRRPLQRRRGDRRRYAGAVSASLLCLAVIWKMLPSVRVCWIEAGGFGVLPRRGRRDWPNPEVDDELGAQPRPTSHSDKGCTLGCFGCEVHKAVSGDGATSTFGRYGLRLLFSWRSSRGAGSERCGCLGGAEFPQGLSCNLLLFGVLSAICMGGRVLLDRSVLCVRVLYYFV